MRELAAVGVENADSLGAGLELPAWLLRAAAETPPDPTASTQPVLGREFVIRARQDRAEPDVRSPAPPSLGGPLRVTWAQPVTGGATDRPPGRPNGGDSEREPALRPLPDGGLSRAMPDWLRGPEPADAAPQVPGQTAVPNPTPTPEPEQPETAAVDDPTDTASFISENDLPEWLRNLAAAEAAQAEQARRVAAEQPSEQGTASDRGRATPATPSDKLLENAAAQTAPAGAWLSRRDPRAPDKPARSAGHEGRGSAFAEVVGAKPAPPESVSQPVEAAPDDATALVAEPRAGRSRQWYYRVAILVLALAVLILLLINVV